MAPNRSRISRTLARGALVAAGAVALRELTRPRPGPAVLVDWDAVRDLAGRQMSEPPDSLDLAAAAREYDEHAQRLLPDLLRLTGAELPAGREVRFEAIGRAAWVEVNLESSRRLLGPIEDLQSRVSNSILARLGREGVTQYLGRLFAFLSGRVLGQYDPQLLGQEPLAAGRLYIVEPNVAAWTEREGLPRGEVRQWLAMHELTHAIEFEGHPWLQVHLERQLHRLMEGVPRERPTAARLVAGLIGTPSQWRALTGIQAAMSLLEGYSDMVMREVGRERIEDFDRLEAAFEGRTRRPSLLERVIHLVTGLEMKRRQYRSGDRFCRAVMAAGGIELLNRAFEGPAMLPTLAEVENPGRWLGRVRRVRAG